MILLLFLTNIQIFIGAVDIDWDNLLTPIGNLFMGNNTMEGVVGTDNMTLIGLFIILILFIMVLLAGIGMLVGSVAILPIFFLVFQYIPPLKIIVAIISGLLLGITMNRLIKR